MSGKMAAIVDYVLGNKGKNRHTIDEFIEIIVLGDGTVWGRVKHYMNGGQEHNYTDMGFEEYIGDQLDFLRNWRKLLDAADLLPDEYELATKLLKEKIEKGY
jgi:hypothetical protein